MGKKRKLEEIYDPLSDFTLVDFNVKTDQEDAQLDEEEIFVSHGEFDSLEEDSIEPIEERTLILSNDPVTKLDDLLSLEKARENIECSSFNKFQDQLLNYELDTNTKFIINKTTGSFTENEVIFTPKRIRWWCDGELAGAPYFTVAHRYYSCCYGALLHSKSLENYAKDREEKSKQGLCRRYKKYQTTKKLGCPVKFVANRLLIFPDLQISGCDDVAKKNKKIVKAKLIKDFHSFKYESKYQCNLPELSKHLFHPVGSHPSSFALKEPIDRRVLEKVKLLVDEAITDTDDVADSLKIFLKNELKIEENDTSKLIPNRRALQLAINRAKLKIKSNSTDLNHIHSLSQSWGSKDEVYFRGMSDEATPSDSEISSSALKFMFVFQSEEMRRLFNLYGSNCVFLDAVHRTCGFVWPIYFLIVNTNQGYQVVGVFVIQLESRSTVSEALEVIKSWNPEVLPKCWLVNRPWEEIRGIEKVYPGTEVFISSYHRIQAWKKKLDRKENDGVDRHAILWKLELVAEATSKKELQSALTLLRADSSFQSCNFKEYYDKSWHLRLKRWAWIFCPSDMYFELNDGVDRLPCDIRYDYLSELKNKKLSSILSTIINKYIPHNLFLYQRENIKLPSRVNHLESCSQWLINMILKLYIQASQQLKNHIIHNDDNSSFTVTSNNGEEHKVSLDLESLKVSCTCFCFKRKLGVICKHVLMIGFKFPEYKFSVLSQWLFNNPLYQRDLSCSEQSQWWMTEEDNESPIDLDLFTPAPMLNGTNLSPFSPRDVNGENLLSECQREIKSLDEVCSQMNDQGLMEMLPKIRSIKQQMSHIILSPEDDLAMNFMKNEVTISENYVVADPLRSFIKNEEVEIDQMVIEIEN